MDHKNWYDWGGGSLCFEQCKRSNQSINIVDFEVLTNILPNDKFLLHL